MFSFPDKYLVVVDIETTDVAEYNHPEIPQIIDIAAVTIDREFNVVREWSSLVQPKDVYAVTDFTHELTGIDIGMLDNAPQWPNVWKDFAAVTNFNKYKMIGWGSQFDSQILSAEYKRWGIGYPHAWPFLDALSMIYWLAGDYGLKPENWSLRAACKRFGVGEEAEHRALSGARKCAEVLKEAAAITE